jgi:hypothetical protein
MSNENARNLVVSLIAVIIGALLAAVTLVGLISGQVNSSAKRPPSDTIPYGSVQ